MIWYTDVDKDNIKLKLCFFNKETDKLIMSVASLHWWPELLQLKHENILIKFFSDINSKISYDINSVQFSSVQWLSCVWLFATPCSAARQASLSNTNFWSLFKLMSIESVMPSNHLNPAIPFSSCLQSFPASGSSQMSQLFTSGGQSIGVSVSVFPMTDFL